MTDAMLHPEFETLPAMELRRLQEELWRDQWDNLRKTSAFYRRKYDGPVADKLGLDALETLPLTDKEELRESQERAYPFGDYIACSEEKPVRLHRTSGTTGRALNLANSKHDVEWISRIGGRAMFASGLREKDRVVHCLNYCLWTGGVTDHMVLEATGATVIPFGIGNTQRLLEIITELGITAISSTPSYPALLEKVLRETGTKRPRDLGLRLGLFGGEAGLDNREFRRALEETWGFGVRNANYGLSEVLSNLASQCERSTDLHFHAADYLFAEILDADGRRLPLKEGTVGELVCSHIRKECQPLVRYRTRDIIAVTGIAPCDCGRSSWRFRVTGRTDDMFNVRGINVFPTAVQKAITSRPDLSSGQFRILLRGPGPYDRIEVKAEAATALARDGWEDAARALQQAVHEHTGATALVVLAPPDSLPRTDGKTKWIERISA